MGNVGGRGKIDEVNCNGCQLPDQHLRGPPAPDQSRNQQLTAQLPWIGWIRTGSGSANPEQYQLRYSCLRIGHVSSNQRQLDGMVCHLWSSNLWDQRAGNHHHQCGRDYNLEPDQQRGGRRLVLRPRGHGVGQHQHSIQQHQRDLHLHANWQHGLHRIGLCGRSAGFADPYRRCSRHSHGVIPRLDMV